MTNGFDINEFSTNIDSYGILNNNKFLVQMAAPACMTDNIGDNTPASLTELLQFRAESVRLPGISLLTADIQRYGFGPLQKMVLNGLFTDTSLVFIADKQSLVYQYFYQWFRKIFDFSGSVATTISNGSTDGRDASYIIEYKDNYVVDLHVTAYDKEGTASLNLVMYDSYPVSFNDIPLDWNDNNSLMKITIGMTFRDHAIYDSATIGTQ